MNRKVPMNCKVWNTLFSVVCVLSVAGCGPSKETRRVVERLEARGAHVTYRGGQVVGIKFWEDADPIGDEDVATLVRLKDLETLSLENTKISDQGLASLTSLSKKP